MLGDILLVGPQGGGEAGRGQFGGLCRGRIVGHALDHLVIGDGPCFLRFVSASLGGWSMASR